jgi:hypothetical protein
LKKAIPKLWKETLITQDSIKTQVIPKKYVKIEKKSDPKRFLIYLTLNN